MPCATSCGRKFSPPGLLAPAFGVEAVAHLHPEVARLGNQVKAFTARIALLDYVLAVGMEIEIGERFQVGGRLADGVRAISEPVAIFRKSPCTLA